MGIYKENTRVAPPPMTEKVPDKKKMFKDFLSRMSEEKSVDRSDAAIMMMCVSRRARCTHGEWAKKERGLVAGCWDMVTVTTNTKLRWAK
jgi:hypothetical protein